MDFASLWLSEEIIVGLLKESPGNGKVSHFNKVLGIPEVASTTSTLVHGFVAFLLSLFLPPLSLPSPSTILLSHDFRADDTFFNKNKNI